MLLERDILGLTPFAFWQTQGRSSPEATTVPEIVASYTSGQHLTIMNSIGDVPLHVAIKQGHPLDVRQFLSQDPQALGRENATGITPLELALEKVQSMTVGELKRTMVTNHYYDLNADENARTMLESKDWREFLPKAEGQEERLLKNEVGDSERHRWVLEECLAVKEKLERGGKGLKRTLVTLGEANEVARRMVVAQKRNEYKLNPRSQPRLRGSSWLRRGNIDEEKDDEWCDEIVAAMGYRGGQGWVLRGRAVVNIV
jgi:hypothetical protein